MVRWLIQWLHWCAFAIAATAGKTATATQFVATDATRHVQPHCRPGRGQQMQECEYGGLLVLLRLERRGRRPGEPLRGRREPVQQHGGLLPTPGHFQSAPSSPATPSAPPTPVTPSAPPTPTLSTAATAATRLLRRFCSLLVSFSDPAASIAAATIPAATVAASSEPAAVLATATTTLAHATSWC